MRLFTHPHPVPPPAQLVRDEVDSLLDHDRWDAALEREHAGAARLRAVSKRWADVEALVG
jgi:hypothetical protein